MQEKEFYFFSDLYACIADVASGLHQPSCIPYPRHNRRMTAFRPTAPSQDAWGVGLRGVFFINFDDGGHYSPSSSSATSTAHPRLTASRLTLPELMISPESHSAFKSLKRRMVCDLRSWPFHSIAPSKVSMS